MRLSFGEDDEAAFFETRGELLDEIYASLCSEGISDDVADEAVGSMSVFIDWRWNYSSGRLDDWALADVDEFLVEWLPRKYSAPPEAGAEMCRAVADFFIFMAGRDRLVGGAERAAALVARALELNDVVVEAMGDPANFGMAKSMFGASLSDGDDNPLAEVGALLEQGMDPDDPALRALLDARMDAFNALPFEQRQELTNGPSAVPATKRVRIPVVDIPPSPDALASSIAASRLMTMVDRLVDHVGRTGIAVTQAGNLRLADARRLVDVLETDDVFDRVLPWNDEPEPVRTSTDLVQLTLVFDVAEGAGAFTRLKTKIKTDPAWSELSAPERAERMVDALLDIGPVASGARFEYHWQVASLVEDAIPHWLSMALPDDARIDTMPFVEQAAQVVASSLPARPRFMDDPDLFDRLVSGTVFEIFDVLDFAGIIDWRDRTETTSEYGVTRPSGGWFRLTPLGRHTMVDDIRTAGYDFPTLADMTNADAEDFVNVALTTDVDPADLLARWRPDTATSGRAAALAEFAMGCDAAYQRLETMKMLDLLRPVADVEPAVRQMLDSPMAGHATMFLLERGLATSDEVGAFLDLGPLVDLLTTVLDEPEVLASLFAETDAKSDVDLIEDLWRHDRPETIDVLEALGKNLPDKKRAKAARKAALKHRSWMANQGRS